MSLDPSADVPMSFNPSDDGLMSINPSDDGLMSLSSAASSSRAFFTALSSFSRSWVRARVMVTPNPSSNSSADPSYRRDPPA